MPSINFSESEIASLVEELKNQLIPELRKEIEMVNKLPPLLTRKQFMELANIGPAKCNEIFHRTGFPVTYELGHPRVLTAKFFEWVENDIDSRASLLDNAYQKNYIKE